METRDAILTRRSVRTYASRPIPDAVLTDIFDVTRQAPSGSNREPTRLVIVKQPERKSELAKLCSNQSFIAQAPIVVAVVVKTLSYNRGNYMGTSSSLVDGAIILDHLTLIARDYGLGTCWIGAFDNFEVKQFLGIPDDWNVVGLTPVGYPSKDVFEPTAKRMPLEEFIKEEQW